MRVYLVPNLGPETEGCELPPVCVFIMGAPLVIAPPPFGAETMGAPPDPPKEGPPTKFPPDE